MPALKTQRLSHFQAARLRVQMTGSVLPKLCRVMNSALKQHPHVWFCFHVLGEVVLNFPLSNETTS